MTPEHKNAKAPIAHRITKGDTSGKKDYVRLEITKLKIVATEGMKLALKKYKGWDLYFAFEIEHPRNSKKVIQLIWPETPIDFTAKDKNMVHFGRKRKSGSWTGSEVFFGPMPADGRINVRVTAIQAKKKARNTGKLLKSITKFVGDEITDNIPKAAKKHPVIGVVLSANKGVGLVGKILKKTDDKDRGWASLDEDFTSREFLKKGKIGVNKKFHGGDVEIRYRWSKVAMGTA